MPLTPEDRAKGHRNALRARQAYRLERIRRAHQLHNRGFTRDEIARQLDVKPRKVTEYLNIELAEGGTQQ